MAGLMLSLPELVAEVGHYMGYGRDYTLYTGWNPALPFVAQDVRQPGAGMDVLTTAPNTQVAYVMAAIKAGLAQVYWPPVIEGISAHRWSFLIPDWTFTTTSGTDTYDLPDDFNGFEGDLAYDPSENVGQTITRRGVSDLRVMKQNSPSASGRPICFATFPKRTGGAAKQGWGMMFFPNPDAAYTLWGRYNVSPANLDYLRPYPYGCDTHGELLKQSCIYAAERDLQGEANGPHKQAFLECLRAAISVDAMGMSPDRLGYNGDPGINKRRWVGVREYSNVTASYIGPVAPTG